MGRLTAAVLLARDVMHLNSQEMTNTVRKERPGNALLHQGFVIHPLNHSGGIQQCRNALVGLAMDRHIPTPGATIPHSRCCNCSSP